MLCWRFFIEGNDHCAWVKFCIELHWNCAIFWWLEVCSLEYWVSEEVLEWEVEVLVVINDTWESSKAVERSWCSTLWWSITSWSSFHWSSCYCLTHATVVLSTTCNTLHFRFISLSFFFKLLKLLPGPDYFFIKCCVSNKISLQK